MKRPTIISLGEVLWDLFPGGEQFGGAPANFACHAAILGADVAIMSAVGNDHHGRRALEVLERHNVDVSFVQNVSDAPTGMVGVELDSSGKPTFMIHKNSAWDQITWNDKLLLRINTADAIYFGTLGQRSAITRASIHQAIKAAKARGIPRLLDINIRPPFVNYNIISESIELANILKLSNDELIEVGAAIGIVEDENVNSMLRNILEVGNLDMIIMTRGADGAILVTPDKIIHQAGLPATVIDTVGAGDAFTAAFLLGLLRNESHETALLKACEVAAATCAHNGAVPETPVNNSTIQE